VEIISKLQQAYLKKYHPLEFHATEVLPKVSQRPEDVRNKTFGSKVSALFRGRREDLREPEIVIPAKSEEVSDEDCRVAVCILNQSRAKRVENLGDGYDCLQDLIFTPTIKDVLTKFMDAMITTCAKYDDLAMNTKAEVKNVLDGTDTSDLRASFRRVLSFSIPPLTLYHNHRPGGYSNLTFDVPLMDQEMSEDNVPKLMGMCMYEVEKRGLDTDQIYLSGYVNDTGVLELQRRFESEKSFSFSSTDNIHFVAMLLKRYLCLIPEPLLVLSLKEYRDYTENRVRHTENDFSLLRSKIRELHPVHRSSLGALLRHFSCVASHSDKNGMTAEVIASRFKYTILRGNEVLQDGVHVKTLVLEDLIQNAHTLFDERSAQTPPVPSSNVAETTSIYTYGSLFLSPELPQSTTQHHGIPTPTHSSLSSSLPSDAATDSRRPPSPTGLLSPLVLGLPSSKTLTEGLETSSQDQVIPKVKGPKAAETLANSNAAEVESVPLTSVAEWRLHQSRLASQPEALTIPQSPPESVLSSTSDFPLSSATSLQTRI